MFKRTKVLALSTFAMLMIAVSDTALSTVTLGFHGEPELPDALKALLR